MVRTASSPPPSGCVSEPKIARTRPRLHPRCHAYLRRFCCVCWIAIDPGSAGAIISPSVLPDAAYAVIACCLGQISCVLKPGGIMVHYFDVETDWPFFGWARHQPWYEEIFVTSKGHFGIRPLEQWQTLFHQAGFAVEGTRLFCKSCMQDLSVWGALNNPLVTGIPRQMAKLASVIREKSDWVSDVATEVVDNCLGLALPDRWSAKVIVRLRKSR